MMIEKKEKLRIDKYLWAIRIFKTRSQAGEACDKGKVKCNDVSVKASAAVRQGEMYEIKTEARKWMIKVIALLENRVQFTEAIKYYEDHTPPEELEKIKQQAESFYTGKRLSKTGRPTKKQRRDLGGYLDK